MPKISVIVATYNRPAMLRRTLESIFEQSMSDYEIIVVNDGGDPLEIPTHYFKGFDIHTVEHKENLGLGSARNSGIALADGKYIAYLDDDDLYGPLHLQQLFQIAEGEGARFVYSIAERVDEDADGNEINRRVEFQGSTDFEKLISHNTIPVNTVLHEKNLIDETGLFSEDREIEQLCDWELWLRMARITPFRFIPVRTCEYRRRPNDNMTDRIAEGIPEAEKRIRGEARQCALY